MNTVTESTTLAEAQARVAAVEEVFNRASDSASCPGCAAHFEESKSRTSIAGAMAVLRQPSFVRPGTQRYSLQSPRGKSGVGDDSFPHVRPCYQPKTPSVRDRRDCCSDSPASRIAHKTKVAHYRGGT
jgi:hypothetical protein